MFVPYPNWWPEPINKQRPQPHVIIELPSLARVSSRSQFAEFYKAGLSLREIEKRTGVAKSTIRTTLVKDGIARRPAHNGSHSDGKSQEAMRCGTIPFGYTYLEAKLVINPPEYKIVLEIYRLWKSGRSFRAIASHLNERKLRTRTGKKWTHEIIKRIVTRHDQQTKGDNHGTR